MPQTVYGFNENTNELWIADDENGERSESRFVGEVIDDENYHGQNIVRAMNNFAPVLAALERLVWENTSKGPFDAAAHEYNMKLATAAIENAKR